MTIDKQSAADVVRGIHFISGLPRSGSALLAAILRQNPAQAGMSSPVASLVLALHGKMSQENEAASFIDNEQRQTILRGAVYDFLGLPAFAHDFENVVFDADEFHRRIGTPGLRRVNQSVAAPARRTVLPPGLFHSFDDDAFWREPSAA